MAPFFCATQYIRFVFHVLTVDRWRQKLTCRAVHVDGSAFPLAELTGRVDGPSTRVVKTGLYPSN